MTGRDFFWFNVKWNEIRRRKFSGKKEKWNKILNSLGGKTVGNNCREFWYHCWGEIWVIFDKIENRNIGLQREIKVKVLVKNCGFEKTFKFLQRNFCMVGKCFSCFKKLSRLEFCIKDNISKTFSRLLFYQGFLTSVLPQIFS